MRGRGGNSLACFQTTSQTDPDDRICPWFLYCGTTMYTESEADRRSTSRSFQVFQAYSIRVRPISIHLEQPQGESLPVQHRLYQRRRSLRSMTIHAIETQPEDYTSCGRFIGHPLASSMAAIAVRRSPILAWFTYVVVSACSKPLDQ
jgi:hypothetical protein